MTARKQRGGATQRVIELVNLPAGGFWISRRKLRLPTKPASNTALVAVPWGTLLPVSSAPRHAPYISVRSLTKLPISRA